MSTESRELPERDSSRPNTEQGLFRKFNVSRTDGSDAPGGKHDGCDYFVIDVTHDQLAVFALSAYADAAESTHPQLAADMRERYALAHSRAQDSGGYAVLLRQARAVLVRVKDDDAATVVNRIDARLSAAEQPAKGEKWRCACGDLNYPNETCAMCNQSAPQPSDPADAVLAQARREFRDSDAAGDVLDWLEERLATPPTALAHSRAQDSGGEAADVDARPCYVCGLRADQHPWVDGPRGGKKRGPCPAAEHPAKGDVPLCEKYGDGCNFPDCPCDVDDPLTQQPFKGECFADALDEDIQEARTPLPSDPSDAVCDCGSNVDNRQPHHDECAIYATPPTAQRHDECEMTEALRACLAYFQSRENIGDEPNEETEIAAWLRSILAHGSGAAVEAVAWRLEWDNDAWVEYHDKTDPPLNLAAWDDPPSRIIPLYESTQPLLGDQPGGVSNGEEALHEAICTAVSLLNVSIKDIDGIRAHDRLREALIAYADAALHLEQAKDGAAG